MQLFVVRHAIAAELEAGGQDAARPLTRKGVERFRQGVKGLAMLGTSFSSVLHSPWRRAAETAQLLAPLVGEGARVETELLCASPGQELLALIAEHGRAPADSGEAAHAKSVAVVGHEPWLGELIGWLTAGDPRAGEALVLKKGSVSWLEGSAVPGGMSLWALLPPRVLRALRG